MRTFGTIKYPVDFFASHIAASRFHQINLDDLDLHVVCPGDNHIWYSQPYDFMSGGYLDHDDIPMLENGRGRYAENIKFPMDGTAPSGTYYFWIDVFDQVDDLDPWVVSVYLTQGENDILQKQYNGVGLSAIFTYEK